jgi:hypothetical protein
MTTRTHRFAFYDNAPRAKVILGLALISALLYGSLLWFGDLLQRLPAFYAVYAALTVAMLLAWLTARRDGSLRGLILIGALAFRLIAAFGEPSLSDDVYRYVWDGRVQLHGFHPYQFAPEDAALDALRDENSARINHPELKTVYPPLSQMLFVVLAAIGAGPLGFKLAMGLLDFGVVLALGFLLRRLHLPRDRLVLYAWNPLAILETAGSGHVEPLGVALVVLAAAWIIDRRPGLSTLALGGAIQAKLLPVVLLPGYIRRYRAREVLLLVAIIGVLLLPYALWGPSLGAGLLDYAGRWERNAVIFPAIKGALEWIDVGPALKEVVAAAQQRLGERTLPWDFFYRHVWPDDVARLIVGGMALVWLSYLTFNPGLNAARESFLALGGVLLLAPTLHPWYLLWVLPFAAAYVSWGWLLLGVLVPLAYLGGGGDVPWIVRALEYLPPLIVTIWLHFRARRGRRPDVA